MVIKTVSEVGFQPIFNPYVERICLTLFLFVYGK